MGKFYRPSERPVTIRVDAHVLACLKREDVVTKRGSTSCCLKPWKGSDGGSSPRLESQNPHPLVNQTPKGCGTQTLAND